jgi:3-oxoacyl-[acyl-carrier protein] reductase
MSGNGCVARTEGPSEVTVRFEGTAAIVTGAGQGISEAYAKALASEGAQVGVADLHAEQAERVAKEIESAGGKAIAVTVDVSGPKSAEAYSPALLPCTTHQRDVVSGASMPS